MDKNILLESGTNELEILEFSIAGNYYGINVAKVKEIINYQPLTPIPNSHPYIEGAFSTRGDTISIVNLAKCLGMEESVDETGNMFLITNFNETNSGFHVHTVEGIHRVNWSQIIQPDAMISNATTSITTGIINMDSRLVLLLDFESIVAEIAPEIGIGMAEIGDAENRQISHKPILYAEESKMLSMRKCVVKEKR